MQFYDECTLINLQQIYWDNVDLSNGQTQTHSK